MIFVGAIHKLSLRKIFRVMMGKKRDLLVYLQVLQIWRHKLRKFWKQKSHQNRVGHAILP